MCGAKPVKHILYASSSCTSKHASNWQQPQRYTKVMELPRSIAREVLELQMCLASQMNNYATSAEVREGDHLGFLNGL